MKSNGLTTRKRILKYLFNKVDTTFPFQSSKAQRRFRAQFIDWVKKLSKTNSDREFYHLLEEFLASLHDSHTNIVNYPGRQYFIPRGCRFETVGNRWYVFKNNRYLGRVISIDGTPINKLIQRLKKRISASTKQFLLARIKNALRLSEDLCPLDVVFRTKRQDVIQLSFPRKKQVMNGDITKNKLALSKLLEGNIGYLMVTTWNNAHTSFLKTFCDHALDSFQKKRVRALIIDVRGNQGGDSRVARYLAERLFEKKALFAISKTRTSKTKLRYKTSKHYVLPRKPYCAIPTILLIDSLCHSSNEYFIAGMKDNRLATVVGETTAGGSGNPKMFSVPHKDGKISFRVSTWREYRNSLKPIEGKGIVPDIVVSPTLNDMIQGRDVALETALDRLPKLIWQATKFSTDLRSR